MRTDLEYARFDLSTQNLLDSASGEVQVHHRCAIATYILASCCIITSLVNMVFYIVPLVDELNDEYFDELTPAEKSFDLAFEFIGFMDGVFTSIIFPG